MKHIGRCWLLTVGVLACGCAGDAAGGGDTAAPRCEDRNTTITTSPDGRWVLPTVPGADDALAAAVAETFCSPVWATTTPADSLEFTLRPVLPADEALCIGAGLVDALGAARVRQLGVLTSGPWSTLSFGLGANRNPSEQVVRSEAEAIVDVFVRCTPSWKLLLALSVTAGAEKITDASATCIEARLDDATGRDIFAGELDRAYDDPTQPDATPFPELIRPLVDVLDGCLTAAELNELDFN